LTAKRISSPDTPATVSCKEKLLIASHNSLLIDLEVCHPRCAYKLNGLVGSHPNYQLADKLLTS
jgi:hypothetical protein